MSNIIFETTGLKPMERFRISYTNYDGVLADEFFIDDEGILWSDFQGVKTERRSSYLSAILIDTKRIIRKPRLTDEQKELLKALVVFEGYWLCKEEAGGVFAYREKPTKQGKGWRGGGDFLVVTPRKNLRPLLSLVSWDDESPLDIEQTLRDAGAL
jgi:hypothetical protein